MNGCRRSSWIIEDALWSSYGHGDGDDSDGVETEATEVLGRTIDKISRLGVKKKYPGK